MKYIHTEINFLREGRGVLQGKWGEGGWAPIWSPIFVPHNSYLWYCDTCSRLSMSPASKRVGKEAKNAEYPVLLGPPGAPPGSVWRLYGSHYSHMRSSLPFRCFPLLTRVKIGKKKAKKLKTSILEKIWIWLGTPNSAFLTHPGDSGV